MPAPGSPSSVSSTWVEITPCIFYCPSDGRELRTAVTGLSLSLPGQAHRLDAVLAGDLLLVGADEVAVADDLFAADVETIDAVRRREDETRDRVGLRPAELEAVR